MRQHLHPQSVPRQRASRSSRISPVGPEGPHSTTPRPIFTGMRHQNFVYANSSGRYFYRSADRAVGPGDGRNSEPCQRRSVTFQHGHEYRDSTGIPAVLAPGGDIGSPAHRPELHRQLYAYPFSHRAVRCARLVCPLYRLFAAPGHHLRRHAADAGHDQPDPRPDDYRQLSRREFHLRPATSRIFSG